MYVVYRVCELLVFELEDGRLERSKQIDRTGRAEENYVQVQAKHRLSPREARHRKRILFSICDDGDPRKETDGSPSCCCCFFYQIRPARL